MFSLRSPGKLFLLLLSAPLEAAFAQKGLPYPLPNGNYNTTVSSIELVDHNRNDPYAETPEPRRLMVSLFHPAECDATQLIPPAPPTTAAFTDNLLGLPNGTFSSFKLQVCDKTASEENSQFSPESEFQVVLFSHGLTGSRFWYNAMAQWVASHGYNVVTIDHPHDASIVEFPDGTIIYYYGNMTQADLDDTDFAVDVRKKDAKFVLDQMEDPEVVRQLIPGAGCGLDVSHAAIFGHSLGGATAANAMGIDSRLKGGINFDGTMFGPAEEDDLSRPFMIFGTETHTRQNDTSWANFWTHLLGWKKGFIYEGAEHLTYTDGPLMLKLLGIDNEDLPPKYRMGDVDGLRNLELMTAYACSFFDFVLKGEGVGVPEDSLYPEISDDF